MDLCPRRPALTAAAGSALRFCRPRYTPAAPACSPRRSDPTARGGDPDLILVGQAEPALPKVLPHAAKRLDAAPAAARCPALTAAAGSAPRFCRPRYTPAAPACSPRRSDPTARGGDPDLILVGQAEPALPKVLPHAAKRLDAAPAAARCPALTAAAGSAPRFCRPRYTPAAPACSPRRSARRGWCSEWPPGHPPAGGSRRSPPRPPP